MGSCFSKKTRDNTSPSQTKPPQSELKTLFTEQRKRVEGEETMKSELFITRDRKSHDLDRFSSEDEKGRTEQKPIVLPLLDNNPTKSDPIDASGSNIAVGLGVLRTSSCTKEEIDAILIQCGRLSRSSSNGKTACSGSSENQGSGHTRKYSGSKRSFDFDQDQDGSNNPSSFQRDYDVADGDDDDQTTVERIRRHHRQQRQSSGRRRRTPSRERDQQQMNSNSSGTSRRVSRSPGRRSESPITGGGAIVVLGNNNNKPGKIVTVPATVTSLVMDKSNNLCEAPPSSAAIKRTQQVKEISAGSRIAASPRSQSPARANFRAAAENPNPQSQQQPLSLSRSNSRKAEQSPFRRNPLGEIDQNMIPTVCQKAIVNNVKNNNPSSYTALLLEDIQNFHQKKELPEVIVKDGLLDLEQSIHHQYVTVRRGRMEEEQEESSGSNSIVSSGHNWVSADSTDTCSSKDDVIRPKRMSEKKKPGFENKQQAAGRIGRIK